MAQAAAVEREIKDNLCYFLPALAEDGGQLNNLKLCEYTSM